MEITLLGFKVLIDDEDISFVMSHKWFLHQTQYKKYGVIRFITNFSKKDKSPPRQVMLHRLIMGQLKYDGTVVDHINGDTLDNRKCNLRLCTQAQNSRNRKVLDSNKSGLKGVSWSSRNKDWYARICIDGKIIFLGHYKTPNLAHQAYIEASKIYHGEYGRNQ